MLEELNISIAKRVENGARWLDENFPGWEGRIDLGTLELEDANNCICGQVFKEDAANWENSKLEGMGFWFAERTLFSEANAWILGSVPKRADGSYDSIRAVLVSQFLGFNTIGNECEDFHDEEHEDGCDCDGFHDEEHEDGCDCDGFALLQKEWIDLLVGRGVRETVVF